MKIFGKIFKKNNNKEKNIIKRHVKILAIKDMNKGDIDVNYDFGFTFIKENNKKNVFIWIDNEIIMLNDGQYCIFTLESDNIKSFRLKAVPDFKSECCNTTVCLDSKVKDYDI